MENREEQLSALPKEMAADQVMAEQVMQDAKQSGNQGNLMLGQDGKIMLAADEQMGGSCDKYWWGQNETEVSRLRLLNQPSKPLLARGRTAHTAGIALLRFILCAPLLPPVIPDYRP